MLQLWDATAELPLSDLQSTQSSYRSTPSSSQKRKSSDTEQGSRKRRSVSMAAATPTVRNLECPIFCYETEHGLPHTCNGISVQNMAAVRRHMIRPSRGHPAHLSFLQLCSTCNEDFIDKALFNTSHGKYCNTPRKRSKGAAVNQQWQSLYELVKPTDGCRKFQNSRSTLLVLTIRSTGTFAFRPWVLKCTPTVDTTGAAYRALGRDIRSGKYYRP